MSKVINGLLTGKVNAHSLTRGDMIILSGYEVLTTPCRPEVVEIKSVRELDRYNLDITVRGDVSGEWTGHWYMNEPVDRVIGARSAGQVGCS